MVTAIFNREDFKHPEDGFYCLEPAGTHPNREAGFALLIDPTACAAISTRFNTDAAAGKLSHGHEMLIDREHFKDRPDKETAADGWLRQTQSREDGLYGRIRWTTKGQAAVDGGEYRFFSTEYAPEDMVNLGGDPPRIRPMRLDGLTLTNMPRNKGGKPITNRAVTRGSHSADAANPLGAQLGAAKLIDALARAEQRSSGGSLASSYQRVMNREQQLTDIATGEPMGRQLAAKRRESGEAPAAFAGRMLLQLARQRAFPAFSQNLTFIRNRFRGLARMENREAGWDALADLEPVARAEYLKSKQNPTVFGDQIDDLRKKLRAKYPTLQGEELWRKLVESDPKLVSQYKTETAASEPCFAKAMQEVMVQYPQLDFQGRWDKVKELEPDLFWSFVLSLASNEPIEK
jgi:hypothetical protein